MQKLRPFLTALLGLTLWVQGLAIAATPVAAQDEAGAAMMMPCAGDVAGTSTGDCCDRDCAQMPGCAVGQLAGTPAVAAPLVAAGQVAAHVPGWSSKTTVPPFPIRPPIVSRA